LTCSRLITMSASCSLADVPHSCLSTSFAIYSRLFPIIT
jgi:hypothetical protein